MKIGIVSDSHGGLGALDAMLRTREGKSAEVWLHGGDFTDDADYLAMVSGKKVYKVAGNGDWLTKVPQDLLIELAGHRIFLTHGHMHGVSYGREALAMTALQSRADIAIYGHTHVACQDEMMGITILNPGSVARPRDDSHGSFMLMELKVGDEPKVKLIRLK